MGTTIDPGAAAAQAIMEAARRAAEAAAKAAAEAAKKAAEAAAKQAQQAAMAAAATLKTANAGATRFTQKDGFDAAPRLNPALLTGTTANNAGSAARLFGGLEPSWLQDGQRPPFISAQAWNSVGIQERNAILADSRSGWSEHLQEMAPSWLQNSQRPPFISEETWNSVGIQERNAILDDARTAWRAAAQEDSEFFFNGVPEGGVRVDHPYSAVDPGMYGQGQVGEFAQYAVQKGSAAQYLNVNQIIPGEGYASAHYNLCGELSVGSMLGIPPSEAMSLFAETGRNGLYAGEITKDDGTVVAGKGNTTSFGDLEAMIEQAGWTAETVKGSSGGPPYTPQQMDQMLESGQGMIALVNIDTKNSDGMLRPIADDQKNVAHWVEVMDVTTTPNGETYVRVYNPYQNAEEVYSWEDFTESWSATAGNSTEYGVIVATPPETEG
jgi:hypothetical protein